MKQIQNNSSRVRVKICGITSVEDGVAALNVGVDAIGCIFYEPSSRYVSITSAKQIVHSVGPFVSTVGIFVNEERAGIEKVLRQVPLQILQFHGDESAEFCEQFHRPYIKVIRMKSGIDLKTEIQRYSNALGILLDTYRKGVHGGTGEIFDWSRVPQRFKTDNVRIIIAGGLTIDNVNAAINQTMPYAIDVSGGLEVYKSKGKKDWKKMLEFMNKIKAIKPVRTDD